MEHKPKYPIYIVSKGRAKTALTAKYFDKVGIDYLIVVEPQDAAMYQQEYGANKVLVLPFSNLGLGSYPARNYCWDHSLKNGHSRHWVFDDNIRAISVWSNHKKIRTDEPAKAIRSVESFADKNNISIAGFEYRYFVTKQPKKAFKLNTHVYSSLLIQNDLPFRWRLKYNEDVDLCLQALHRGGQTASSIYYMIDKVSTVAKMKGGNQTELYKGNDPKKKLLKAKMLESVWPQYAKTVIRFGRYHHYIDWKQFQTKQ